MSKTEQYKKQISQYLNGKADIYLYWKGRVALYALLKAKGVGSGAEVIIPGFTCVVVPNAIKYVGAKPVYVDVDKQSMNATAESYKNAITPKTKAILTQNTFGLSHEIEEIIALAKANNIFTIEDCTHGFGGTYNGQPNGTYCDAAFFSTQWNKPFSTGVGGFAVVNDKSIIPKLEEVNRELLQPGKKEKLILSALLFAYDNVLNESTYWSLRKLYRFLSKHNLVVGSSQGEELTGTDYPETYFKSFSKIQVRKGAENLASLPQVISKRKQNSRKYTNFLKENKKYHVAQSLHTNHSFLKYPVLVEDQKLFEEKAFKAKIELGDWFCSPIYPVMANWEKWNLQSEKIPTAMWLSRHIVNLPTETNNPEKVIDFLKANLNDVI